MSISEPKIKNFPIELFGYAYTNHSDPAKDALANQFCPFLKGECKKPRKSNPKTKIGICSVGYKAKFTQTHRPVIICPHRLIENIVFKTIEKKFLQEWTGKIQWASEIGMGVGGNVDYVAFDEDPLTKKITDFLCVEFQAAGTTGTPWPAVLEFKKNRKFKKETYKYGINWANEFIKTMMQQVYKKGKIIEHWKRQIVFVVQDIAIEYIHSAVDSVDLYETPRPGDNIHFLTFRLTWRENGWALEPSKTYSTNLEGVNKLLGGAHLKHFPSEKEFMENVQSKFGRSCKA